MRTRLAVFSLLAALLWTGAFASPVAYAQKISEPELFEKSLEVAHHALDQYGAYDDPEQLRRINDIGYAVALQSGYTDFPFTFHLVDMPEPNAFALPAGHIFITRGMLELGLTDDMLAALLGHEIAHVVEAHYKEIKKKATLMNIISQVLTLGVVLAADDDRDRYHPLDPRYGTQSRKGDLIQGAAATSLAVSELLLRNYSRENEAESDVQGQRWAAAAGYDPLGAAHLMELMGSRIPQSKKYGYWMTHPFFDERVSAANANGKLIKRLDGEPADGFRQRTQATLLSYVENGPPPEDTVPLLKDEALAAWPIGRAAEGLRLEKLHALRDAELEDASLSQDFGMLIRTYTKEAALVHELDPETSFPVKLEAAADAFGKRRDDLYPKAREVLDEGVYETAFLETFLSNYPDAPEVPRVALALGDAYSRLGNEADAVRQYLRAWETGPNEQEGQRAARGLRILAPRLESLSALEQLALQPRDEELAQLAAERLEQVSKTFRDIDNGADYLHRFPDGSQETVVLERMSSLAEELLAEVYLYQAVGDTVKALERINQILNHAPTSPAAERLRDRAIFES